MNGFAFSLSSSMRAMEATGAPVSIAVELATLVISALRNFSGSRRCGLVSMSGFCSMDKLYQTVRQTLLRRWIPEHVAGINCQRFTDACAAASRPAMRPNTEPAISPVLPG